LGGRFLPPKSLAECSSEALAASPAAVALPFSIAGVRREGLAAGPAFTRVFHAKASDCPSGWGHSKHGEEGPKGRRKKGFQRKSRKKIQRKKKEFQTGGFKVISFRR
jgi:hypothetical protein